MIPQLRNCVDHFKEKILDKVDANFWIAGGALRDYFLFGNTKNCIDIDLFFPNRRHWRKVKEYLDQEGYQTSFESDNSLKMTKGNTTFDLVKIFHHDPQASIYCFDFTICCCAVDRRGIYHHETFFIDLAQKNMIINSLDKPFNTISRIRKYMLKGFYIDNENFFKVIKAIREAPEETVPQIIREASTECPPEERPIPEERPVDSTGRHPTHTVEPPAPEMLMSNNLVIGDPTSGRLVPGNLAITGLTDEQIEQSNLRLQQIGCENPNTISQARITERYYHVSPSLEIINTENTEPNIT